MHIHVISLHQIFPAESVKKEGKRTIFQQQNAFFFKIRIFCMQNVYGKFLKIMKIDLNTSKSMRITKMSKKKNIQFLVCKKVIFHYFQK